MWDVGCALIATGSAPARNVGTRSDYHPLCIRIQVLSLPPSSSHHHNHNHFASTACTTTHFPIHMDASTDSSIDELAARTTVKDYGNIRYLIAYQPYSQLGVLTPALMDRLVKIPGCSTLSKFERTAVFNRAQYRPRNTRTTLESQANVTVFQTTADGNSFIR